MPTSSKIPKRRSTTPQQSPSRFSSRGSSRQAPPPARTRARASRRKPSALIKRAQASLPGRRPKVKQDGGLRGVVRGVLSSIGSSKDTARSRTDSSKRSPRSSKHGSRTPSKKGVAGLAASAGLGVAAVATRRSRTNPEQTHSGGPAPVAHERDEQQRLTHLTAAKPNNPNEEKTMQIPKEQILQMLRDRGEHDRAQQAEQKLPDQVDPEQHSDLLSQIGIDPGKILGGLEGKVGL